MKRRKTFIFILAFAAFALSACGETKAEPRTEETVSASTEQTASSDPTEMTSQTESETETATETAAVTETATISESVQSVSTAESMTEASVTEVTEEFIYPDEPLTPENLIKITTQAKMKLWELGENSADTFHCAFGLIDIDFDGFPEMFCESCFGGDRSSYIHKLYSLKDENFCEKMLEYKAYAEIYPHRGELKSEYFVKQGDKNNIVVYSHGLVSGPATTESYSEMEYINGKWSFNEKYYEYWKPRFYRTFDKKEHVDFNAHLRVDGNDVYPSEYREHYDEYISALIPAEYAYEGIEFVLSEEDISNIYGSDSKVRRLVDENYNDLYVLYDNYMKSIIK